MVEVAAALPRVMVVGAMCVVPVFGGLRRIGRAAIKQLGTLALLAVSTAWPQFHDQWLSQMFWVVWVTYFAVTAVFDAMSGLGMVLVGVWANESFDASPLAASPRDFWGRRWNLLFRNQAHRHIFLPLGGRGRPAWGVFWVFAFSMRLRRREGRPLTPRGLAVPRTSRGSR